MSSRSQGNIRDVSITTATTGLNFAAALVAGIVVSRVLGPTGKGQLAQLAVWASFAAGVLLFGAPGATTYSVARWPGHRAGLVSAVGRRLVIRSLGGVFLFSLLATARGSAQNLPLLAVIAYAAWLPAAMAVEWSMGYLQGRSDFARFNWVRLASSSSPVLILIVLAAVGGLTVPAGALVYAAAVVSAASLGLVWTRRDARLVGSETVVERRGLVEILKTYRSFARREYASTLAKMSNRRVDLLVVSLLSVVASDIGIYSVATSSSGVIALVGVSIGMVAFTRSAQGGNQQKALKSLLLWGTLLTGTAAAVLYVLAPKLIPLVYGSDFQESVPLVRILVSGAAAVSVSQILAGILRGLGRPGSVAIAEGLGAGATAVGIVLLGTDKMQYVAYSAVAGFGLTLLIEIAAVAVRFSAEHDRP